MECRSESIMLQYMLSHLHVSCLPLQRLKIMKICSSESKYRALYTGELLGVFRYSPGANTFFHFPYVLILVYYQVLLPLCCIAGSLCLVLLGGYQ